MAIISLKDWENGKCKPIDKVNTIEIPVNIFEGYKVLTTTVKLAVDRASGDYAKLIVALKKSTKVVGTEMMKDGSINMMLKDSGVVLNFAPFGKCIEGIADTNPARPEMAVIPFNVYVDKANQFFEDYFINAL